MSADDPVRLELYVRSLLPPSAQGSQNEVIDDLETLVERGVIDEYTLLVWGDRAPSSPGDTRTDAGVFALNRVAVFTEWAERNDRRIDPFFERRTVDSRLADEHYQAVVFPTMTLAEYEGQDLRFVAPSRGPEQSCSVPDRVSTLLDAAENDRIDETLVDTDDETGGPERLERAYAPPPRELTLVDPDGQG